MTQTSASKEEFGKVAEEADLKALYKDGVYRDEEKKKNCIARDLGDQAAAVKNRNVHKTRFNFGPASYLFDLFEKNLKIKELYIKDS